MSSELSGSTTVACVIGDPVRHSRSPAIHNAGFAAVGLDWAFVAFEVVEGDAARAVEAMRALRLGGMSVTMPHKDAVVAALDDLSPVAARLDAVNCVAWAGERLVGHNTDGGGFVSALGDEGVEVASKRCVVLGAGGAARSVALALGEAGAAEVAVSARRAEAAVVAAELAGPAGAALAAREVADAVRGADLLVNATPLGMAPADPLPVPAAALHPELFVAELVYHPARTALLEAAEAAGAQGCNGLGMLVHQAAVAFELWTGVPAPLEAMTRACVPAAEN